MITGGLAKSEAKALAAKWNAILAAEGFEDIEYLDKQGEPINLVKHSWRVQPEKHAATFASDSEYYRAGSRFLVEHRFKPGEKAIWRLHIEGVTYREIVRQGVCASLFTCHRIVNELRVAMKRHRVKAQETYPMAEDEILELASEMAQTQAALDAASREYEQARQAAGEQTRAALAAMSEAQGRVTSALAALQAVQHQAIVAKTRFTNTVSDRFTISRR